MDKRAFRETIFQQRDALTAEQIREKSLKIADQLYSLSLYIQAGTVMFFLSFRSEVDTRPAVEKSMALGKQVCIPKAIPKTREMIPSQLLDWEQDLVPGAYDIPEPRPEKLRPVEPAQIDLLIVPGVAFDLRGNRLGYGGGYYDRFFPLLRPKIPLVALAFELQIVSAVPVEEWDRQVHCIVTENRVILTKQ